MTASTYVDVLTNSLLEAGIEVLDIQERAFPGEHWLITFVQSEAITAAQKLAGTLERTLNSGEGNDAAFVVMFQSRSEVQETDQPEPRRGRLAGRDVDQLIQLLEARSRTSDALPSLQYMEDPRASLAAVGASRHQMIYGRRGVGKTALLLEAKRIAERDGHLTVWLNAHVIRRLAPAKAVAHVASLLLQTLANHAGTSQSQAFIAVREMAEEMSALTTSAGDTEAILSGRVPAINNALRTILREGIVRLYVYIDDFYLMSADVQPLFLDFLSGLLRDCNGWLKVASIERLTRPWEPSSRVGLEIPHDATKIDIDVTLEEPFATQRFLEGVLVNYTKAAGIKSPSSLAKSEALGRLVLASGGVPRDYLNLFASSLLVAREKRELAKELGREDVAIAAGRLARGKKRDLEQDVGGNADALLGALEKLSSIVKGEGFAYFRIDVAQKASPQYELLALLVDLRFAHLVQSSLSDQHRSGVRYEAYVLDLSEFSDVRLKRGLNVLDLEEGQWTLRKTGQSRSKQKLSGTQLRDQLRLSPIVDLRDLSD